MKNTNSLTELLREYSEGKAEVLEKIIPLVNQELHRLAEGYLKREKPGHTLQPTALVNEAFLTLINQKEIQFTNRSHFFAIAALAMRQVLVAYARKRNAEKRGGGWVRVTLKEQAGPELLHAGADILSLEAALVDLAKENERQAKIVELRYFGGMSIEETAEALGISPRTVKRDWMVARAWLYQRLTGEPDAES